MMTWTLILFTIFPLYDMGRFQRRDYRRIERAERKIERKEVREIRKWQKDGIEKGTPQVNLLPLKAGLAHMLRW